MNKNKKVMMTELKLWLEAEGVEEAITNL